MKQVLTLPQAGILSEIETREFQIEIDLALRTVSYEKLESLIYKFDLQNLPESKEFLERGKHLFGLFNNVEKGLEVVAVDSYISKCTFCSIGKTVTSYDINYKNNNEDGLFGRVIYSNSIGINLRIENSILQEFAWCNVFLSKQEVKELNIS